MLIYKSERKGFSFIFKLILAPLALVFVFKFYSSGLVINSFKSTLFLKAPFALLDVVSKMRSAFINYAKPNYYFANATLPVDLRCLAWRRSQSTLTPQVDAANPETDGGIAEISKEPSDFHFHVKAYEDMPGPTEGFWKTTATMFNIWREGIWRKPDILMERKREKFGNIFKENIYGKKVVTIFDLDDIEKVFRNEGKWPNRGKVTPFLAHREERKKTLGVLLQEGKEWQRNRAAISRKLMRPKEIGAYTGVMNDVVTDLLIKMENLRNGDGIVPNMEEIFFRWAMESGGNVIFGKRLGLLGEEVNPQAELFIKAVHDIFETIFWLYAVPVSYHKKLKTKPWKKHLEAWDTVYIVAEKLINEKLNEVSKKDGNSDDLMTYLASNPQISIEEVYSNATELLTGSVDTTTYLMVWVLYFLSENTHIQEKLHHEVTKVVPKGRIPNLEDLDRMLYLKAVVKETLRLRPPAIMIMRSLPKDIVLQNYHIPAETLIQMPFVNISKDPDKFKDPLEFRPERWLRDESEESTAFKALPFGFGPRMCLGKRLAELEAHLLLTRISQCYQVLKTKDNIEPILKGLYVPDKPLDLKFVDRS